MIAHVVQHESGRGDVKLIGVYSTTEKAAAAIARAKLLPGFAADPDGFSTDAYAVDEDCWAEGFVAGDDIPQARPPCSDDDKLRASVARLEARAGAIPAWKMGTIVFADSSKTRPPISPDSSR